MPDVQISLAEVSELQGKGIDVLTRHVVESQAAKSASNDPADVEAAAKAATEAQAKAKEKAEADKPKPDAKAKPDEAEGMQKRMNELTKARRVAERKAVAEAEEHERTKAELKAQREQTAASNRAAAQKEPKREDFDDNEGYLAAKVKC